MARALSLSAMEWLELSAVDANEGAGAGWLGGGVTRGPRAPAAILEKLGDRSCPTPLSPDDAGTVTHPITIKKTTIAAPTAARRLILWAIPALSAARGASLASE